MPITGSSRYLAFAAALLLSSVVETQVLAQTAQPAPGDKMEALDPRVAASRATNTGIWKAVVPPIHMNGQFADHDPMGLVAGKLIPADCSINWTDPDTHKLYCFSSATSLVYFLYAPHTNIARATKGWVSGS
jgi:hypothetical protein